MQSASLQARIAQAEINVVKNVPNIVSARKLSRAGSILSWSLIILLGLLAASLIAVGLMQTYGETLKFPLYLMTGLGVMVVAFLAMNLLMLGLLEACF